MKETYVCTNECTTDIVHLVNPTYTQIARWNRIDLSLFI